MTASLNSALPLVPAERWDETFRNGGEGGDEGPAEVRQLRRLYVAAAQSEPFRICLRHHVDDGG